jgi:hypothetical protein
VQDALSRTLIIILTCTSKKYPQSGLFAALPSPKPLTSNIQVFTRSQRWLYFLRLGRRLWLGRRRHARRTWVRRGMPSLARTGHWLRLRAVLKSSQTIIVPIFVQSVDSPERYYLRPRHRYVVTHNSWTVGPWAWVAAATHANPPSHRPNHPRIVTDPD